MGIRDFYLVRVLFSLSPDERQEIIKEKPEEHTIRVLIVSFVFRKPLGAIYQNLLKPLSLRFYRIVLDFWEF